MQVDSEMGNRRESACMDIMHTQLCPDHSLMSLHPLATNQHYSSLQCGLVATCFSDTSPNVVWKKWHLELYMPSCHGLTGIESMIQYTEALSIKHWPQSRVRNLCSTRCSHVVHVDSVLHGEYSCTADQFLGEGHRFGLGVRLWCLCAA